MKFTERRKALRAILSGTRCVRLAPTFDAVSARLAEDMGFEGGMLGGMIASAAVIGAPDLSLLTLSELAAQVRRVCRATALPLVVDADNGFGPALNVMRAVEELETVGASAIMIEDSVLPPVYGAEAGPQMVSLGEGVGKIRAAVAAREDPALVIIARTISASVGSIEDANARVRAYAEAGADAVVIVGAQEPADIARVLAGVPLPVVSGAMTRTGDRLGELAAAGVRLALPGQAAQMASAFAVSEVLRALHDGAAPASLLRPEWREVMRRALREDAYEDLRRMFWGGGAR